MSNGLYKIGQAYTLAGAGLGAALGGGAGFGAGKWIDPTGNVIAGTGALAGAPIGMLAGAGAGAVVDTGLALRNLVRRLRRKRVKHAQAAPGLTNVMMSALSRFRKGVADQGGYRGMVDKLKLLRTASGRMYLDTVLRAAYNRVYEKGLSKLPANGLITRLRATQAGSPLIKPRTWTERDYSPKQLQAIRNLIHTANVPIDIAGPVMDYYTTDASPSALKELRLGGVTSRAYENALDSFQKRLGGKIPAYRGSGAIWNDAAQDQRPAMQLPLLDIQTALGQFGVSHDLDKQNVRATDTYNFNESKPGLSNLKVPYKPDAGMYSMLRHIGGRLIPEYADGQVSPHSARVDVGLGPYNPLTWSMAPEEVHGIEPESKLIAALEKLPARLKTLRGKL